MIEIYDVIDHRAKGMTEGEIFRVKLTKADERALCECNLQRKTGIACAHIFKVLICTGRSVLQGVWTRWKLSEDETKELKKK